METSLNLGSFLINNIWCVLILKITVNTTKALFRIPLPKNYPPTNVGNSLKVLFEARITKLNKDHIFIDDFRIFSRQMDIPLTQSEGIMLKGLGKRSLCKGLPIVLNYWKLANSTSLGLSAQSGIIPNYHENVQRYVNLSKDNLLQILLNIFSEPSVWEGIFNTLSVDELVGILVRCEANLKLANYYQLLGFEIISSDPSEIVMSTTVKKFLNSCENLYLRNFISFNDILNMLQSENVTGYYFTQIIDDPNSLMIVYDKTGNNYIVKVYYNKENNNIYPPI